MTIEISAEVGARLKTEANAAGLSIEAYLERLVLEEDTRRMRLAAFEQAIEERIKSLNAGETSDGEEVMARLIAELDEPRQFPTAR